MAGSQPLTANHFLKAIPYPLLSLYFAPSPE